MKAEIITIGDEILIGQINNTNSTWMARELSLAGVDVRRITTVADDAGEITAAVKSACTRAELILMTGGLGPTRDDITKKTLASIVGRDLIMNDEVLKDVMDFFAARGKEASRINQEQALVPAGSTVIRNRKGTAPGMWIAHGKSTIVSMPGVPYEMTAMMETDILPMIRKTYKLPFIHHTTILTQGIGESALAEIISAWEDGLEKDNLKLAYLPQPGLVRLRISGSDAEEKVIREKISLQVNALLPLIGQFYCGLEEYGNEPLTLEKVIADLLRERGQTLALAESCTGGYISSLFTAMPGASAFFRGAIIPYANVMKHRLLNVDERIFVTQGAVSRECVEQLAQNTISEFDCDFAVAVSGIAGPSGATAEKPVGTVWIAVADRSSVLARKFSFGFDRQRNIMMAANAGMQMLRRLILENNPL